MRPIDVPVSDAMVEIGGVRVRLSGRAMDGIRGDGVRGLVSLPKHGTETGGLLTGVRNAREVLIDGFVPVPCEHRFGPGYRLSDRDRELVREGAERHGTVVIGFYRSRIGARPNPADLAELHDLLPGALCALVIVPEGFREQSASLFVFERQQWKQGPLTPFPFESAALPEPVRAEAAALSPGKRAVPHPEAVAAQATRGRAGPAMAGPAAAPEPAPRAPAIPAPVRRHLTAPPAERRSRGWLAAVAVLILLAGGGVALREPLLRLMLPPADQARTAAPQQAAPASTPNPSPGTSTQASPTSPLPATPEPQASPTPPRAPETNGTAERTAPEPRAAVRSTIQEWARAMGDSNTGGAAAFYAARLSSYNGRRYATRDDVRRRLHYLSGRYGHPVSSKIEGMEIVQRGNTATATLVRSWATSARFHGDDRIRMTLSKSGDGWKIVAEQTLRSSVSRAR